MSLALARKYRPATFDDLIGQDAVSRTLSAALETKRLSHAYLFSGLRGSGKTSTARIFAKALLCEKGETPHPCGECTHCTMAAENRHMDIIEMDAASNRGIEDIKELIEHTKYKPATARYKIFIIDEVHMLTTQAFNALLKTLEEPPDFVKFILATTDPLKLPATILSRTQHFRFKKIPQTLVVQHLEHILNLEKISFEPEAIEIIARSGAGSLRDSLTLLDQAIVYSKHHVDLATVTGMLGIIEPQKLADLMQAIFKQEKEAVLRFLEEARDFEAEMIVDELTLFLKERLLSADASYPPLILERFFRALADAKSLLAMGSDGEFVLSLTLFKMLEALQIKEIDRLIHHLEKELKPHIAQAASTEATPKQTSAEEAVVTITQDEIEATLPKNEAQSTEPTYEKQIPEEATTETIPKAQEALPETEPSETQNKTQSTHERLFAQLIEKLYDRDYDLGKLFEENVRFISFEKGTLTWESHVNEEEKRALIKAWGIIKIFAQEIFGLETKIENIAKKKVTAHRQEEAPTQAAHSDATASSMLEELEMKSSCIAPEAGETEAAKEKDPSTLLDEPMIKEAISLLNPKKVRIKRKV